MNSSNNAATYGFRIIGGCTNDRRLIDWPSAFVAYSQCDNRAEVASESYLSAFTFGRTFADHLNRTGTTKGFTGATCAAWLWFDIDRDDIDAATADARRLASSLIERFGFDDDALLCFFSGRKGYHIGLPLSVCGTPGPSVTFHNTCRRFAESAAAAVGVDIDAGVYDRVRAFRAPNSRHQKTGLHKRQLPFDVLMGMRSAAIVELAQEPEAFDIPDPPEPSRAAVAEWSAAVNDVADQAEAIKARNTAGRSTLNRATLEFITDGATTGDRHRLLFSAAANLAEFGCNAELAAALLSEPALDSGLSPSEVQRQIQCGLEHRGAGNE